MKIAIVGDTHFGYPRYEEDSFTQGESALRSAIEKADMVILAGDIFHQKSPSLNVLGRVTSIFRSLPVHAAGETGVNIKVHKERDGEENNTNHANHSILNPIAAIHGTHERHGKGITPVRLLEKAGLLTDVDGKIVIFEKKDEQGNEERVMVTGIGGIPDQFVKDAIRAIGPKPIDGMFSIFVLHQSIKELMYDVNDTFMSVGDLPPGFQLYVNGHIHKPISWDKRNTKQEGETEGLLLLIPGSTVLTQLKKDELEKKGYWLFDTKTGQYEFITIKSRPFIYREIELKDHGIEDAEQVIIGEIKSVLTQPFEDKPIVRIMLKGTLRKGLSAADLHIPKYDEIFDLQIDSKDLSSDELAENIERIRKLKDDDLSVRDFGIKTLADKMKTAGVSIGDTSSMDITALFDLLVDDPEEFYRKMMEEGEKRKMGI